MTTTFAKSTAAAGLPVVRVFVLETMGAAILAFETKALREAAVVPSKLRLVER